MPVSSLGHDYTIVTPDMLKAGYDACVRHGPVIAQCTNSVVFPASRLLSYCRVYAHYKHVLLLSLVGWYKGVQTLWTQDSSDPGHFGTSTQVLKCLYRSVCETLWHWCRTVQTYHSYQH